MYPLPRLTIQLIYSLQSLSFCPGFYNEVDTGHLCNGTTVDKGGIRGATTLSVISQDVDQMENNLYTESCYEARELAVANPSAAGDNSYNYSVRIITRVSR